MTTTTTTLADVLILVRRLSPTDRTQLTRYLLTLSEETSLSTASAVRADDPWERLAQLRTEFGALPRVGGRTLAEQLAHDRDERERSLSGR